MAVADVHKLDIGNILRTTVKDQDGAVVNVSTATTKDFILKKPNGVTITKASSFYTDGTDGILQYQFTSGDLDQSGLWKFEVHVVIGVLDVRSDIQNLQVDVILDI